MLAKCMSCFWIHIKNLVTINVKVSQSMYQTSMNWNGLKFELGADCDEFFFLSNDENDIVCNS